MKKLISLILSVVMVLTMFSVVGYAIDDPFAYGYVYDYLEEKYYWELSEDGGTLTITGSGDMKDLSEVPGWLSYSFNKVVIGEGITAVPEEAFLYAEALEAVEFSSTVQRINQRAFYGCKNLKNINLQDVSTIEAMAFYGCLSYRDIEIPESVKEIGNYALGYYCNEELDDAYAKLPEVTISARADSIAKLYSEENGFVFVDSTDYTEFFDYLVLEEDYVILTEFKGCPFSVNIIIPEEIDGHKVRGIADYVFEKTDVKSVYIPSTVKNLNTESFENASELAEIICEEMNINL